MLVYFITFLLVNFVFKSEKHNIIMFKRNARPEWVLNLCQPGRAKLSYFDGLLSHGGRTI